MRGRPEDFPRHVQQTPPVAASPRMGTFPAGNASGFWVANVFALVSSVSSLCSRPQPLELICEKAIATCNRPLGPGEALRRVMECIASGILLPGRPLLHFFVPECFLWSSPGIGKLWPGDFTRLIFNPSHQT